ncbi:MAG: chromosome segregation protein SMC [Synechococcales bacterium]|nr:chromosome segregation protein SMC [Synechococcales bacterium]
MYIKCVELSHFKSFGGTTQVPLCVGFTVISGPNGSGKSNILDALLFALGLSSSKGMRADKLPDLVNQNHSSRSRATVEATVTVTFDIGDIPDEWLTDDEADSVATLSGDSAVPGFPSTNGGADGQPNESSANGHGNSVAAENGYHNGDGSTDGVEIHPEIGPEVGPIKEWKVTRRLRVTPQGTYTSSYFINDQSCTLTDLHEQLQRFRIYPEGYNVVLQGDVTSIISMNPRERREIIDELAGVASFDRKINQAKEKLDAVQEREERFRIVEKELTDQRDRLAKDRIKAEKYQALRATLLERQVWEAVLSWRSRQRQVELLQQQIVAIEQHITELIQQRDSLATQIQQTAARLDQLNARVKALGEDEQLALRSVLATREAEQRQLQRQEQELVAANQDLLARLQHIQEALQLHHREVEQLGQEQQMRERERQHLEAEQAEARQNLEQSREAAMAIAAASEAWVQEQAALRHQVEALLAEIDPQRREQARLQERFSQLDQKIQTQTAAVAAIAQELTTYQSRQAELSSQHQTAVSQVQSLARSLAAAEQELQIQQETQSRLLHEQRDKQRQLDKLEAQAQAMQESQGTHATKMLLQTGLPGICGLVAQLGRVDPQYQLALEIAAGGRLGHLVVEDDGVAAAGIRLLKEKRAGRATFLPLNKIRAPRLTAVSAWQRPPGMVDYAVNLIDCDAKYRDVFAYVFGNTVVFSSLTEARQHLGDYRIVTLEGELLEASGAMTGGSLGNRQGALHFGTVEAAESAEAIALRQRLHEIDRILDRCEGAIAQATVDRKTLAQELDAARQQERETQLQLTQLQTQIAQMETQREQGRSQLDQDRHEWQDSQTRLQTLEQHLPQQEAVLQQRRQTLADLEQSQTHQEWQQAQAAIREREAQFAEKQLALRSTEQRLQDLTAQQQRLQEKIQQGQQQLQTCRGQQRDQLDQLASLQQQQTALAEQIAQTHGALATLEQSLAAEKAGRDRAERQLRDEQTQHQQLEWQLQKQQETRQTSLDELEQRRTELAAQQADLPDPLPEVPADLGLEQLQQEVRSLQKRLQAMEPVNMLALEEHERTQERLQELTQKLTTLEEERTELLLRIENFTTLRQRAFKEAFDAVNENFQTIFAELSDGDGYLQLDNPDDPFSGGLNLVAHPKGKPVRRLASMSGGEKSLTALSFIFALQRYRPSPFYAFDEVDMFLDGANVERLAKMIKRQSLYAQFIVVSLRRPMIESAERTIGVTQARGAYTQVLGLDLQPQRA